MAARKREDAFLLERAIDDGQVWTKNTASKTLIKEIGKRRPAG